MKPLLSHLVLAIIHLNIVVAAFVSLKAARHNELEDLKTLLERTRDLFIRLF